VLSSSSTSASAETRADDPRRRANTVSDTRCCQPKFVPISKRLSAFPSKRLGGADMAAAAQRRLPSAGERNEVVMASAQPKPDFVRRWAVPGSNQRPPACKGCAAVDWRGRTGNVCGSGTRKGTAIPRLSATLLTNFSPIGARVVWRSASRLFALRTQVRAAVAADHRLLPRPKKLFVRCPACARETSA